MNQYTSRSLFALLRSAIDGYLLSENEKKAFSEELLSDVIATSQKHDLTHLVAFGLSRNQMLVNGASELDRAVMKAVYRYEQLNHELNRVCEALEKAEIAFMPLKGSVMRRYYAEPWMRSSCDIDILVQPKDLDRAVEHIVKNLGYVYDEKGGHDVSLFLGDSIHLELHYTLIGDGVAQSSCEVLSEVWQSARITDGSKCQYEMTDEMFYFYHIAHMAKHIEEGGCGVRPFVDLWILDHLKVADHFKRNELLKKGNLLAFAQVARTLSKVWLEGDEFDAVSRKMEYYILRGGVYGNKENRVQVQQTKKGGRLRYACSRIFLPYDTLKFHYPILEKHRWLTPICEVRRWGKLIFRGGAKRSLNELSLNAKVGKKEAEETAAFLAEIGL